MWEKNQKMCGRRSRSTLTNIFWFLSRRFNLLSSRSRGLMENLGLTQRRLARLPTLYNRGQVAFASMKVPMIKAQE
jgi:hypothetical protein